MSWLGKNVLVKRSTMCAKDSAYNSVRVILQAIAQDTFSGQRRNHR